MNNTGIRKNGWTIETENEKCRFFEDIYDTVRHIEELECREEGEMTLWSKIDEDHGRHSFLSRLFYAKKTYRIHFITKWNNHYAFLVFHDLDFGEYWVLQSNFYPITDEIPHEALIALSHGEPTPLPREYCLRKTDAFALIYKSSPWQEPPKNYEYKHFP